MSIRHINTILAAAEQSGFASVMKRALWLASVNSNMQKQLPPSLKATVKLVNIDARNRAIIYIHSAEWASVARFQQNMFKEVLRNCGVPEITAVIIKNRPWIDDYTKTNGRRKSW